MVKLVVCFQESDGYTYSCNETIPVEFDSPEKFIVMFDELIKQHEEFTLANRKWYRHTFQDKYGNITLPEVFELNEWFDKTVGTV